MKALLFALVFVAQTAFAADMNGKTLVFCDYASETSSIYMDLLFDYDQTKDMYSHPEVGVVVDDTSVYPDYLYTVTPTYSATDVTIVATKDANSLSFVLPTMGDTSPSIVLDKSTGFVADFNVHVTGMYNGTPVDADFLCYDPAAQQAPR